MKKKKKKCLESQVAGNKQLLAKVPISMLTQTGMMSIKLRLLQPASAHLSLRDETLGSDIASSLETLDIRRHKHYGHTRLRHHASSLPWVIPVLPQISGVLGHGSTVASYP